jgi:predicted Zn-dependent peptidase
LYDCYHTFYHPSNMTLFVVGGVEPEATFELVRQNQAGKSFPPGGEIRRIVSGEPPQVRDDKREIKLPVSLPKCLFGFKEPQGPAHGEAGIRQELAAKLALEMVLGASSPLYQRLYDDNLISDNFGHEYTTGPGFAFSIIGGDTPQPEELMNRVTQALYEAADKGIESAVFERTRRKRIGGFLRMLNSPESIANEFTRYRHRGGDLFRVVQLYESLSVDEVNTLLRSHVSPDRLAASVVRSAQE